MLLLTLFWFVGNDFQIANPQRCMLRFTSQLLLFVVVKGLKMSDSKGDYKTRSPKYYEKFDTTIYLHITREKETTYLKRPSKNGRHNSNEFTL